MSKFTRQPMGPDCWYQAQTRVEICSNYIIDMNANLNFDDRHTVRVAREPGLSQLIQVIVPRELNENTAALELFNMLLEELKTIAMRGVGQVTIKEYTFQNFHSILCQEQFISFRNLWKLIRNQYISSLFPLICDSLGIDFPDKLSHSLSLCPKEILDSVVQFMERSIVDSHLDETSTIKDLANGFLHTIIWSDYTNTEIILEAVRQTFVYKDIKASLTIICKWIKLGVAVKDVGCIQSKDVSLQLLLQRCISYFQFAQLGDTIDPQYGILFDQIYFSRFLVCENIILSDAQSQECLMMSLLRTLELKEKLLGLEGFNEVCTMLAETIWYTWIKSDTKILNSIVWKRLEEVMSKYKTLNSIIKPWSVSFIN